MQEEMRWDGMKEFQEAAANYTYSRQVLCRANAAVGEQLGVDTGHDTVGLGDFRT